MRSILGYDPFATAGDCRFDAGAGRLAIDFFRDCLTFAAGDWMGRPFVLQPWQQAIVEAFKSLPSAPLLVCCALDGEVPSVPGEVGHL